MHIFSSKDKDSKLKLRDSYSSGEEYEREEGKGRKVGRRREEEKSVKVFHKLSSQIKGRVSPSGIR